MRTLILIFYNLNFEPSVAVSSLVTYGLSHRECGVCATQADALWCDVRGKADISAFRV